MNIQETLKELLENRREALIENYRTSITNSQNTMKDWAAKAAAYIRENMKTDMMGETEYVSFHEAYSSFYEKTENTEAIDQEIFEMSVSYGVLQSFSVNGKISIERFPCGSWARQAFKNFSSGTLRYDKSRGDGNWFLRWSTEEEIQKRSEELADEALSDFVSKMTKKMSAIGEVKNATIDYQWGNLFQTCLNVEFENGIRFNMVNSIVFKTSNRGLPFHQFPARFNAVTLNGVPQKGCASEAAVKRLAKSL